MKNEKKQNKRVIDDKLIQKTKIEMLKYKLTNIVYQYALEKLLGMYAESEGFCWNMELLEDELLTYAQNRMINELKEMIRR